MTLRGGELWEKLLQYLSLQDGIEPMNCFLHSLKDAGYDFQEEWIRDRSEDSLFVEDYTDKHEIFRRLLELFTEPICRTMEPEFVIPYFYERNLLRGDHQEVIMKYKTHNQKVLGILHYMTLSGIEEWPKIFCEVLLKAGNDDTQYAELARLIAPKIGKN